MLPIQFPPETDETPVSWMHRLAVANGYEDVYNMFLSLNILKSINNHNVDLESHLYEFIQRCFFDSDIKAEIDDYVKRYERIRFLAGKRFPKQNRVCPLCMKEELESKGFFYHHMQHQYIGTFTCWKHYSNLSTIKSNKFMDQFDPNTTLVPIIGDYDTDEERRLSCLCQYPNLYFNRVVRYQINAQLNAKGLSYDDINKLFVLPERFNDIPDKLKAFMLKDGNRYTRFESIEKHYILANLFKDYDRYLYLLKRKNLELAMRLMKEERLASGDFDRMRRAAQSRRHRELDMY